MMVSLESAVPWDRSGPGGCAARAEFTGRKFTPFADQMNGPVSTEVQNGAAWKRAAQRAAGAVPARGERRLRAAGPAAGLSQRACRPTSGFGYASELCCGSRRSPKRAVGAFSPLGEAFPLGNAASCGGCLKPNVVGRRSGVRGGCGCSSGATAW